MTTSYRSTPPSPESPEPPRSRPSALSIGIWVLVAVVGAVCWGVVALVRDEHISAVWLLGAALGSYAIAYRFYAKWISRKVLGVDDTRATPAERLENDLDYQVTDRRVLFGHHFAAIAGAGPLVGPVLAAQMGYLPGTMWIIVGVIFAGAVQDMIVLFFSMRRDGKSIGQMAREEIGPVGGAAALIGVFAIMIILLAVLALVVVNAMAASPWATFSIAMTIPIALFMGFYLRTLRPGQVMETTVIGVALLLLALVGGGWVEDSSWAEAFTLSPETLVFCLIVYGFVASVLPVWMLLAPRDYLSTFMKIGTIALLAVGMLLARPVMENEAVTDFATNGEGPVFAGALFPFVFITIACGALSGFHALIASGTTPKMIEKESQIRMIGYGGMLAESFVAVCAIICASIIDPGLYYAMNMPAGALGDTLQSASDAVASIGFTVTPDQLQAAATAVEEDTLVARTGGAPTLAVGMSAIFSDAFGGGGQAFWYHFAIMFEALFILTTVDAGTRVGRFMLQDMLGNVYKPMARRVLEAGRLRDQRDRRRRLGLLPLRRGHRPARRHQPAVPAVRHRQPAARGDRPHRGDDADDQARQAEVGLGARHPARVGRRRDAHRQLAEGVLRRPDPRVLRPAGAVLRRDRGRRGAAPGDQHGRHAPGRHQHDGRRHPGGVLRDPGGRRARRRGPGLHPHPPRGRGGRDDGGAVRPLPDRGAVRADPDQGGEAGDGVGGQRGERR